MLPLEKRTTAASARNNREKPHPTGIRSAVYHHVDPTELSSNQKEAVAFATTLRTMPSGKRNH
jgi:hypothetical protein